MTSLVADYLDRNQTSGVVNLFQLDASPVGGSVQYFTDAETSTGTVIHNGLTYTSIPVALSRASMSTTGTLPQPQLSVAVTSNPVLRSIIAAYGDLVGCKVTKFSTLTKYLDAANFTRYNAMDYSEDLAQAAWAKSNTVVTSNAVLAPDGTMSADLVLDNAVNAQHHIGKTNNSTVYSPLVGDWINVSCYVKDAGIRYVLLYIAGNSNAGVGGGPLVDLQEGTILGYNSGVYIYNASITPVSDGWFKVTFDAWASVAVNTTFRMYLTATASTSAPAYLGTGTDGAYLWGVQMARAKQYTAFVSTSMTGNQATVTSNTVTDPILTTTADTLTDNASNTTHNANIPAVSGFLEGQDVNFAIYLKANTITKVMVRFLASSALPTTAYANVDLSVGTVLAQSNLKSVVIQALPSSWYRVVITATCTANGSMQPAIFCLNAAGNNTYIGTGSSFYFWNGSMYAGTDPQPYQRTTTSHQPSADPAAISPVESYYVTQLLDFGPETVTWRLNTPLDRPNLLVPRLQYLHDKVGNHISAPGLSRVFE